MLKRVFIKLTLSFFFFSSLSYANLKHEPDHFVTFKHGKRVTTPGRITKAYDLHKKDITGKGIKIAIIDESISPKTVDLLNKKGCILPSAIQKKLVLNPSENLENLDLKKLNAKPYAITIRPEHKELVARKKYFDEMNTPEKINFGHGVGMLRAFHSMAPGSQLLPIDIRALSCKQGMDTEKCLVSAVREAIDHKVDAISLSLLAKATSRAYTNILKEAAQKGIALFFGAGNESTNKKARYLGTMRDKTKANSNFDKRDEKTAFEELKGKNMLFCGALGHSKTGEEVLSEFSEHPTQDTLMRYVVAPGQDLFFIPLSGEWITADTMPREGTSYSAPITAGGFALLKQYVKDKKLAHTNDDLLRTLYTSGHNLNHDMPGTPFKTYKALNLHNAIQRVDHLASQPSPLPPATKTITQPPKKQVTSTPKGRIAIKKTPVQTTKKTVSVVPKGRAAVKKAPVQTTKKPVSVAPKRRVAVKKAPVQTAKKTVSVVPKGRVAVKKAPVQTARKRRPVVRKGRAITAQKISQARRGRKLKR